MQLLYTLPLVFLGFLPPFLSLPPLSHLLLLLTCSSPCAVAHCWGCVVNQIAERFSNLGLKSLEKEGGEEEQQLLLLSVQKSPISSVAASPLPCFETTPQQMGVKIVEALWLCPNFCCCLSIFPEITLLTFYSISFLSKWYKVARCCLWGLCCYKTIRRL